MTVPVEVPVRVPVEMPVVVSVEVLPESWLRDAIGVLVRLVETSDVLIIFIGAVWAFSQVVWTLARCRGRTREFTRIRLTLGRFLTLGLEFQLAGDVLRTAVAPSFTEIGQLAAIAGIRTALNYFLAREISAQRVEVEHGKDGAHREGRRQRPDEEAGECAP